MKWTALLLLVACSKKPSESKELDSMPRDDERAAWVQTIQSAVHQLEDCRRELDQPAPLKNEHGLWLEGKFACFRKENGTRLCLDPRAYAEMFDEGDL